MHDPKFVDRVPEVIIMGGGHAMTNTTASAEFNIWADPEAATLVLNAGFRRLTLVPLDATHQAVIPLDQCAASRASGRPAEAAALFVEKRIEGYRTYQQLANQDAAPVHDALCVAAMMDPPIITTDAYRVDVETRDTFTVGRSVIDVDRRGKLEPNCRVAMSADTALFARLVLDTLSSP